MNGPEVYKFAVNEVPDVIAEALINAGLRSQDVDWLLLHQVRTTYDIYGLLQGWI